MAERREVEVEIVELNESGRSSVGGASDVEG